MSYTGFLPYLEIKPPPSDLKIKPPPSDLKIKPPPSDLEMRPITIGLIDCQLLALQVINLPLRHYENIIHASVRGIMQTPTISHIQRARNTEKIQKKHKWQKVGF